MSLVFEWDQRKARSNLRKHRVSFSDAVSVFSDPLARIFPDEAHSVEELREIIIGHSQQSGFCWFVSWNQCRTGFGSLAPVEPPRENSTIMKNTSPPKKKVKLPDGLQPEYRFDYSKSAPSRFAERAKPGSMAILLDPDVARVFKSAEAVNSVLRALMTTMPSRRTRAPG